MTDKILEVRGLTKTYGGEKRKGAKQPTPTLDVLKGIDIDIYRGDVVCLIGPSGCGKSTFLRCLNRLEIPTGGSIKFEGVEVDDDHIDAVRQKMGMVFQHFNLFPHLTVKKNLELAPSLLKLKDKEAISARADELLAIGIPALRIICPHFLLAGAGIVLSSVFQALGNGVFSLTVSICRQLVVLIPAAWLLSRTGEVNMVWWSFIIAEVVSLTLSLIFMARINRTVIVPLYEEQDAAV